jgi:hypothetical protein
VDPQLKYAGEAICLVGIAFRLLRWAFDAVREGDAPPSAYAIDLSASSGVHPPSAGAALSALVSDSPSVRIHTSTRSETLHGSQLPTDPNLFPPEMLAAMTPEQRAKVQETMAKTAGGKGQG